MNASLYNHFSLRRIVEPPVEPVTLAQVKVYLRVPEFDDAAEDARLESMIKAVREWCEEYTLRAFVEQTWRLKFNCTPHNYLKIPRPPLLAIDSISYIDCAGDTNVIPSDSYVVNYDDEPALIARTTAAGCWPSANIQPGAYTFVFVAGYAPTDTSPPDYRANIPERIKNAILMYLYEWYWNCGGKDNCAVLCAAPGPVKNMLSSLRVFGVA
jgi:uncharacterized phiE125 gp8 family phage protein